MDLIDHFEALPRLDLIGFCPIKFRDVMLRLFPGKPEHEIDEDFEEYCYHYRLNQRRMEMDS